jgi:hypothetical protein
MSTAISVLDLARSQLGCFANRSGVEQDEVGLRTERVYWCAAFC